MPERCPELIVPDRMFPFPIASNTYRIVLQFLLLQRQPPDQDVLASLGLHALLLEPQLGVAQSLHFICS